MTRLFVDFTAWTLRRAGRTRAQPQALRISFLLTNSSAP